MTSTKTQARLAQVEESTTILRDLLPPGSVACTILRHVSRSGMTRYISVVVNTPEGIRDITWHVAQVTGMSLARTGEHALNVGGCGMDMGFHVVYTLSRSLYPNGHHCIGQEARCPSNDHSNDYGALARQYAEAHGPEYEAAVDYETRSAYCAARADWMKTQEAALWSPERVHSDGGYAISQRWI